MPDISRYSLPAQILALKMTGHVGPRTFELLLSVYHTVDNILQADKAALLELDNIGPTRADAIADAENNLDKAEAAIDGLSSVKARAITCFDDDYPDNFLELNDPPPLFYCQGQLPRKKCVALIGSQDISADGIAEALELGNWLATENVGVISGLARGVDTSGLVGALRGGGAVYAVLPCGFNKIHPAENAGLARDIAAAGGLISEYLPDTPVSTGRLMSRNRLIVGLADAVIIGEVAAGSEGTLDAALCCNQIGKIMFVNIGRENPHYDKLAGYGAIPVTGPDDYPLIVRALV